MNKHMISGTWAAAACVALLLSGCQKGSTSHPHVHPAQIDKIDDKFSLVTFTEKAIERVDVQTATVIEQASEGAASAAAKVVPYSALVYDAHGDTWVYISPKPRAFQRAAVKVDRIVGNDVFLTEGPDVGTVIATVGVAEIYGAEFAVGH